MKLTPLDIHHKEFRHSLRGYAEDEVDQFLDEVADELERLFKENIDLSERLDVAQNKVNEFEMQRHVINNTLMAAQRSSDEIVSRAGTDAESIKRDADMQAKEIIHNALSKKQQIEGKLVRIKQAEEEFRSSFRSMLEAHLRTMAEIKLPDDVEVLLGETDDGVVGDVVVQSPSPAPRMPAPSQQPTHVSAPVPVTTPSAGQSGVVAALTLGEMGGQPPLSGSADFALPSFRVLGDREDDDVDIEEID